MKTKRQQIGTVGIDAGLLMLGDPCYVIDKELGKKPWGQFLDDMYATSPEGGNAYHWTVRAPMPNPAYGDFPSGVVVTTGYGDGEYPVFAEFAEDGRVVSVTVQFIDKRQK